MDTPATQRIIQMTIGVVAITGALAFGAQSFLVPWALQLDSNFTYEADIVSLDNFYDEEVGAFQGAQRSVTTFEYHTDNTTDGVAQVANIFDVHTLDGDLIVSISRQYGIDQHTWMHVPGAGEKDRQGYLFAPRNVQKNDSFTYWHVNYDTPVELVFDGEEVIDGLTTYRFSADFGVDQTNALGHLPGVPEERGVNLDVSLTIWIEPTTGWLVKYTDSAIAYYYDQQTGTRTIPWNVFSNRYTKASIITQVDMARELKLRVWKITYGIPFVFFVLGMGLMLWRYVPQQRSRYLGLAVLVVLTIGAGFFTYLSLRPIPVDQFVVGISRWVPYGNGAYDENIRGFKDALRGAGYIEGEDIVFVEYTANAEQHEQSMIARKFVAQDNVDLIYSLTTPGTLVLKEHISNRPIVFSIVTYPVEAGVIKSLRNSGNNLVGTRNWVPVIEQLETFLKVVPEVKTVGFIHRTGEPNSTIQFAEMQEAAAVHGIEVLEIAGEDFAELQSALAQATELDSLYSACDTLVQGEAEDAIIAFAKKHRIPSFSCNNTGPQKGDLIGLVANFYRVGKLAGEKAVLVLEGASPASLETNTSVHPSLYVNMATAELLGLTIPQSVLTNAEEIIY